MKSPQVGQQVWADGLKGTYLILAIHPDHGLADLQLTGDTKTVEKNIPFGMIHALGEDTSQTAARIVSNYTGGR
ncbi:MAG: hypothetical protein WA294_09255 [Acidobacteriaceae bacterium]